MKIVVGYPPNYEQIRRTFDLSSIKQPVFAYGDILYNPTDGQVSDHLMVHEEVHERQQNEIGVEVWWKWYLMDAKFRIEQEVEAFGAQYRFVKEQVRDRNVVARFLHAISMDLSGPMYGNAVSYGEAESRIRNASR